MTRCWPPGIRIQFTLWYTTIFVLILTLFGVIFAAALNASLVDGLDVNLQLRMQQVASGISNENGTIAIQDVSGELPGLVNGGSSDSTSPTPPADVNVGALVRILDAQGTVRYRSPAFRQLTPPAASVSNPLHGNTWKQTVLSTTGQSVRLLSVGLSDNGQVYGIVQVGEPLAPLSDSLQRTTGILWLLAPFLLVLTALGSYWLSGRAFLPIIRLTRAAHTIGATDLHQRVPLPSAHDEVYALAQTLNAMITRLESAFAQQQRFVSDASHELRTPVAALLSMAENALAVDMPAEYVSTVADMSGELQRMGALIADLLALARTDEGQLAIDREPVRLDLLACDVVEALRLLGEERGITLQAHTPQPVTLDADAARLIQVLIALVDNALRYTNPGGVVTIAVSANAQSATVTVTDSGIGIASKDLPHIFERFYRADPARVRINAGSGLGLAIVESLILAHGGGITVMSQPAQGTRFTVTLPLHVSGELKQR